MCERESDERNKIGKRHKKRKSAGIKVIIRQTDRQTDTPIHRQKVIERGKDRFEH